MSTANQIKENGNQYFCQGNYTEALKCFTELIEILSKERIEDQKMLSIAYSNRSACYISLNNPTAALLDAEKCIQYDKQWVRGYSRKGVALFTLQRYEEAIQCYQQGLVIDATNETLLEGLKRVKEMQNTDKKTESNPTTKTTAGDSITRLAYGFFAGDKIVIFRTFQMVLRLLLCMTFFSYCLTSNTSNYYTFWKLTFFHYLTSIFFMHGLPKWRIEYGIAIVQNPSLQYLMYTLLFYTSQPMFLAFLPVMIIEFTWLVWYITQICLHIFPSYTSSSLCLVGSKYLNVVGKRLTNYETWDILEYNAKWNIIMGCIPQYSSYADVFVGLTLIFDLLTPQRNLILLLVYWQLMRVRYMLSPQIQASFRKIDEIMMHLLSVSFVPKIFLSGYLKFKGFTSRLVQTPDPSQAQASRPKCTIM